MAKDKELAAEKQAGKKESAKKNSKKQGKIAKWFKDLKLEMRKVVWPSRQTVTNNSIVVFATMLGGAVITFLLDQGFLWLFQFAISGKK